MKKYENEKLEFVRTIASYDYLRACPQVRLFIACQSALETDYGKSAICLENYNLFGMKMPNYRPTTALGINRRHAKYKDYIGSYLDYCLWLAYNHCSQRALSDVDLFAKWISTKNYCPSPTYVDSIIALYRQYAPLLLNEFKLD